MRRLLLALITAGTALCAGAQARFDFDRNPGTLPKSVLAPQQQLMLELNPERDDFQGQTTITLLVRRPVTSIELRAHQLQPMGSASLLIGGNQRTLTVQADAKTQTWRLLPADGRPIAAGPAQLRLAWSGQIQRNGSGLFQAPYLSPAGKQRMLATQLQAVFARMLFPSFDEPAFRTRFQISVRTPAGWEVLSNMPLASQQASQQASQHAEGGRVLHRFAATPPMPSYLVSVAVGRFDALQGQAAGVPLRILTVPGKRDQGAYALRATEQLLPYFTAYFGQPYALPKLDQLAVPSTRNGAMEDWGLISYAESSLLFDPATGSTRTQRGIFNLLAHEVAHQWFGNLVTAASWEEIWLNEAFATWMADKASHRFNPQWQGPLRQRRQIDQAMERDGGLATRAIRSGAVREDRVFDVFDNITYTKGGAVLGMLEAWIGEEPFRRGLASYMKARRMSNATAGDLWFHLGRASGLNNVSVAAVAASWTDQSGFPRVDVDSRCEGGATQVDLAQQPFNPLAPQPARWQIPLVLDHGGKQHRVLLQRDRQRITLPGCPASPLLVNPLGVGFYRVAYAPALQAALAAGFAKLPAAAQVTLMSDTFALAQTGVLPMSAWVDLLGGLPQAQGAGRAALLAQAQSGLRLLGDALTGSPAEAALNAAARALLSPELQTLGWAARPGEDAEAEALRASLIGDLARLGDPEVLARAQALFDEDDAGLAPVPAALRQVVIEAAGRVADGPRFDALRRRLLAATSEQDRWLFAQALAHTPDAERAQQLLDLALTDALPVNLANRLPGMLADSGRFGELAYRHVVQHWAALSQRAGDMWGARSWLLPGPARSFNSVPAAQRLLDDQQRLLGDTGAATAQRVAARIQLLAAVQRREVQRLVPALQDVTAKLGAGPR